MKEYSIADILLFPYPFAPTGWMFCNGQILQIHENHPQNEALFSLIQANYGGDGKSTFALPNLQGFEPQPGLHYCICITGTYPMPG